MSELAGQIIAAQVGAWQQDTLNVIAGAPQAASAPFGYVTPDGTARVIYQDVNYRDFLNVEIGTTEARKAQVLGLDDLDRPQGTQRLFISKGRLW